MKNRISFCVNTCKKTTFRFIGGLQNVLRFLNTVSTLVRGLEEKGFVKYKAYGNTYQYYAAVSDKEYKRSALNDVVAQYYNNSYTNVVSTFIEEEGMSVDELKALIAEIESKKSNR